MCGQKRNGNLIVVTLLLHSTTVQSVFFYYLMLAAGVARIGEHAFTPLEGMNSPMDKNDFSKNRKFSFIFYSFSTICFSK